MLASEFKIEDDFPAVSYEQWRALAEADLKGESFEQKFVSHTYEGIDVQPLYTRRDQLDVGERSKVRGLRRMALDSASDRTSESGWDLRQEHAYADLKLANQAILEDLAGGVTSICVQFDSVAQHGFDPDDRAASELAEGNGVAAYAVDDLDTLFSGVDLSLIGVALKTGAAFLPAAAMLIGLWRHRGIPAAQPRGTSMPIRCRCWPAKAYCRSRRRQR